MAKDINVKITGDASDLERALRGAGRGASKFGNTFGKVVKAGAVAAGAGIAGLAVATKIGVDELFEAQKVGAQTNAVLKSTGKVANVSAKQVEGLAESLMMKTGVDDEAIQSGENLLLTFTNIRNEVGKGNDIFDQATKATLDMSVAMGQDMSSSAVLVGKALNDPIRGMTALRRVGVSFTDAQENTIRKLVETGREADAQRIILRELRREFGGSAEAAGKTLPGQLNILKQRFSNFAGDLVAKTLPVLQRVVDFFTLVGKQKSIKAKVRVVLEGLGGAARDFWDAVFGPQFERKLVEFKPGRMKKLMVPTDSLAKQFGQGFIEAVRSVDWEAVGAEIRKGFTNVADDIDEWWTENVNEPTQEKLKDAFTFKDVDWEPPWDSEGWDPGRFGGIVSAVKDKLGDLHDKMKEVTDGGVAGASDMRGAWFQAMDRVRDAGRRAFGDVTLQLGKTSSSALKAKDRIEEVGAAGRTAAPKLGAAARTAQALADAWNRVVDLPSAKEFTIRFRSFTTVEENRLQGVTGSSSGGTSGPGARNTRRGADVVNLHVDGQRMASAVRLADGRWAMQNG